MIYIEQSPPDRPDVKTVSDMTDFHNPARSDVIYELVGSVDMGSTSIVVPATGITIVGKSANFNRLYSTYSTGDSENPYKMFVSDVGGSGTVFLNSFTLSVSGTGSQLYDLTGATGFEALEVGDINYEDCSSLGEVTNYRQGLETRTGRYGGSPSLTLSGTWLGGYRVDISNALNLDSGYAGCLFEEGTDFVMNDRFYINMNIDLPTNAGFSSFTPSNFTADSLVQVRDCRFKRNGVALSGDNNYFPNLDPDDLVCSWYNNIGLRNTHEGGKQEVSAQAVTTIAVAGTYYDVAGTFTPSGLQHFSGSSTGTLTNNGVSPIEFELAGSLTIEGTANDSIVVKIVRWNNADLVFEDVAIQNASINSLVGPRNVAIMTIISAITLEKDDYVKLQITNLTTTNSLTVEDGSYFKLDRR